MDTLPAIENIIKYLIVDKQKLNNYDNLIILSLINKKYHSIISKNIEYLKKIQTMKNVIDRWRKYKKFSWRNNNYLWKEFFVPFTKELYDTRDNNNLNKSFPLVDYPIFSVNYKEKIIQCNNTDIISFDLDRNADFIQLCENDRESINENIKYIEIQIQQYIIKVNNFIDIQNIIFNINRMPYSKITFHIYLKIPTTKPILLVYKGIIFTNSDDFLYKSIYVGNNIYFSYHYGMLLPFKKIPKLP